MCSTVATHADQRRLILFQRQVPGSTLLVSRAVIGLEQQGGDSKCHRLGHTLWVRQNVIEWVAMEPFMARTWSLQCASALSGTHRAETIFGPRSTSSKTVHDETDRARRADGPSATSLWWIPWLTRNTKFNSLVTYAAGRSLG